MKTSPTNKSIFATLFFMVSMALLNWIPWAYGVLGAWICFMVGDSHHTNYIFEWVFWGFVLGFIWGFIFSFYECLSSSLSHFESQDEIRDETSEDDLNKDD